MIISNSKDRPVVEASLECGEVITDILMRGEVLAEVPLIGTAIKICKAADAIRDRAFAIKLSRFVINLEGITDEQKNKLREKIYSGTKEAQKVGETLFFVLERVTDLDKPALLSQVFLAYIDGVISGEELCRLCSAIDAAFAEDLHRLLATEIFPERSNEPWMGHLMTAGLTRFIGGKAWTDLGELYYLLTPLGHTLRRACSYAKPPATK